MLQCQRHENNYPINTPELQMEAQRLYQAGAARWGTDESVFTQIFATRSQVEIAAIAKFYQETAHLIISQQLLACNKFWAFSRIQF